MNMAIPMPHRQLFIDGVWREPVLVIHVSIINPATEEIIGKLDFFKLDCSFLD